MHVFALIALLAACSILSNNQRGVIFVPFQPNCIGSYKDSSHIKENSTMSQTNAKRPIINKTPFRSTYSTPYKCSITFPDESPYTKQSFKDECDINYLMERYETHGELPPVNQRMPQYMDTTGIDYEENLRMVTEAQQLFNDLPSNLRNRFHNNPAEFLDFCSNEENRSEMLKMGLLKDPDQWVDVEQALEFKRLSKRQFSPSNPEPLNGETVP